MAIPQKQPKEDATKQPSGSDRKPTLEELVRAVTAQNRHPEIDWGQPVGKEYW
jgi:antitoxin component of MazEF toxin-antitoxin module